MNPIEEAETSDGTNDVLFEHFKFVCDNFFKEEHSFKNCINTDSMTLVILIFNQIHWNL